MNDSGVLQKYSHYPPLALEKLKQLRALIFAVASELDTTEVEESLKWGEYSYSVKGGSPVRMDWKPNTPDHYYLFFNCQTKLVDTFRELYGESLTFQGNRAIILSIQEPLPQNAIMHSLQLAFTYNIRKHLPLLGA